ncbi:hypothetical protein, partial [Hungatella effluvii]|uniref:hypothetical protein n=1 Tax=Hungatella effluvii TaxID=1096246 RepID=UPI002A7FCFB4
SFSGIFCPMSLETFVDGDLIADNFSNRAVLAVDRKNRETYAKNDTDVRVKECAVSPPFLY